ncbi:hypothetical protein H4Q26_002171 [Puccinia striiformis f. sp. tritici PST-130]|nr:hypothetical protein H4Q26_002171 [Puccinia striiformis f. sp. tritici PST-130]
MSIRNSNNSSSAGTASKLCVDLKKILPRSSYFVPKNPEKVVAPTRSSIDHQTIAESCPAWPSREPPSTCRYELLITAADHEQLYNPHHPFIDGLPISRRAEADHTRCRITISIMSDPILIQGSLLHPKFARWRILRWLRLALTPLNVYLGLKAPLEYVFTPLSGCGGYNFCLCIWGTQLALKAIQLGLAGGFMEGRCWTREEAALTASEKAYTIHAEPKQTTVGKKSPNDA